MTKVFYMAMTDSKASTEFYNKIQLMGFKGKIAITKEEFKANYKFVADVCSVNLEYVFMRMQGENWSPHGEARDLITALGVGHTSMSVGDIAQTADGSYHIVANFGFDKLDF